MWDNIVNVFDNLTDYMHPVLAVICMIFLAAIGFGIGFGLLLFLAWIIMLIYNTLAAMYNWPVFSIWFWLGVEIIVNWLRTGKLPITLNLKMKQEG